MDIYIASDYEEMSDRAADLVIDDLRAIERPVLGLATGSTPEGLYTRLVDAENDGKLDFSDYRTFNLDEYVGLEPSHEQSYHYFMNQKLFNHVSIDPDNTHLPDGQAEDLSQECRRYEETIRENGGIDLQVLGIGRDGHIGFNEPGTSLASRTHVATLAPETVEDNSRFFDSPQDVPRFAVTMGIRTILDTEKCLLLASGERKADALQETIEGPVTASVTATALQMHPNATVIADEAAASELERKDYYKWVQENRHRIEDRL